MFQTSGFNREQKKPSRARVITNRCKVGLLRLTSSLALSCESETRSKVDLWFVWGTPSANSIDNGLLRMLISSFFFLRISCVRCHFVEFDIYFLGLSLEIFASSPLLDVFNQKNYNIISVMFSLLESKKV